MSFITLFLLFASGAGCHQAGREIAENPPHHVPIKSSAAMSVKWPGYCDRLLIYGDKSGNSGGYFGLQKQRLQRLPPPPLSAAFEAARGEWHKLPRVDDGCSNRE
jgi:hypothetical protein